MNTARTSPELITLQSLRLAGFADEDGIADRALLGLEDVRRELAAAERGGYVESLSFAGSHGRILTQRGQDRLRTLLAAEADRDGARDVLAAVTEAFEQINGGFVETVSRWQLQSTAPATTDVVPEELLCELAGDGRALRRVLADLVAVRPRFGRYPAQYELALRRAREDGLAWVTGVGILSCHVVWAELHQDLLSSLGRSRESGSGEER